MNPDEKRIELRIDIFDKTEQQAQVLPTITTSALISAILEEFHEDWDYLGTKAESYELCRVSDLSPLEQKLTILDHRLDDRERLILREKSRELPSDAHHPSQLLYLREQATGIVHKLDWLPAIIGRHAENLDGNERLAVDLESSANGLRVSRRHAQIIEEGGQFYIECLSQNPTSVRGVDDEQPRPVQDKIALQPNDLIILERSEIHLKFLTRSDEIKGDEHV